MPKVKRTRKRAMSVAAKRVNAATRERSLLVDPNRESTVKVERTAFSLPSVELSLRNPKKFRVEGYTLPQGYKTTALRTNAPTPGFVYISSLVVANVLGTVGVPESARPPWRDKLEDERLEEAMRRGEPCIALDPNVFPGEELRDCGGCYQDAYGEFPFELPTLHPSTRVTLEGFYSGHVPAGYMVEAPFLFTMTFSGYATLF